LDNQGKQTELVKREIVNSIIDRGLKNGDRIPTQAELRAQLGVGNAVIGRAVQSLTEDGILESRGRNGVVVCCSSLEGYAGRTVGLICHRDTQYTMMAAILQNLGIALSRRACQPHIFVKKDAELKDSFRLDEFSGASHAVKKHQIDGILSTVLLDEESLEFCRKNGVPVCYVGVFNANAPGAAFRLDLRKILMNAAANGYRRPMLIHMGHPKTGEVRRNFLSCADLFDFGKAPAADYCRFIRENASSSWDLEENRQLVRRLIREIRQMDDSVRPDVLIIPDDIIALWTAFDWSEEAGCPEIIHIEFAELGYSWQLRSRGDYYLGRIEELADEAVRLLIDLICGRKKEDSVWLDRVPKKREND
jgi:DNA-binding transcriptional regulator YhcF (GntR family)